VPEDEPRFFREDPGTLRKRTSALKDDHGKREEKREFGEE
jgi:hypothetical protein